MFDLPAYSRDLAFCCEPEMNPEKHVYEDYLCRSINAGSNGCQITSAIDDPAVSFDYLRVLSLVDLPRRRPGAGEFHISFVKFACSRTQNRLPGTAPPRARS